MTSSYPVALDSFTNPTGTDDQSVAVGGRTHSVMHADTFDAIEAVQGELGVNPSGSAASVAARLAALDTTVAGVANPRIFDVMAHGGAVDGTTDDTAAWQATINACAAAGGGVVTSSKSGVSIIGGALQDTSGANAQLLLPAVDYVDGEPIGIVLTGLTPAPSILSVIGTTVVPDNHLVLKSTLTTGTGAVIGAKGPTGTFGEFTSIHLHLENLTVRTVANPTITALDLHRVASTSIGYGVVIDTGSYDVDALAQPTTSTSYGLRLPANNNGAQVDITRVDVVGFYTGVQHSEHLTAEHVVTWGCRVGLETNAGNHASKIKRFMAVHCTTPWKATGAAAIDIDQFDIEHANSSQGWRQTTNDIDDASNYLLGLVRWWAVLAGTGAHNSFTKNGATGITASQVGAAPSGSSSLTVQDENSNVSTAVTQIDFQGAGVTATAGTGEVVVTIPGGSGTPPITVRDRLVASSGDATLTLGATPVTGSPLVWVNNIIKWPITDYTISGTVITFNSALSASDVVLSAYQTTASSPGAAALTGPTLNIVDNFNRTATTNGIGSTSTGSKPWTVITGTWGIISNQGYESSSAVAVNQVYVESGAANCTVATKIGSNGFYSGLLVRSDGAGNGYLIQYDDTSHVINVQRRTAGANTQIGSSVSQTLINTDVLSVVLSGSSIVVKVNGVTKISTTDTTYQTNTKHGLWSYAAAGSFDDFSIQP